MREHCQKDACCHHHHDEGCHGHSESCHSHEEGCHHEEGHGEFTHHFLEVADCAWMEVLKDKIKEHILATENDRMKELAKIIAEANKERWKHRKEKKKHCKDLAEKLCNFFAHSKK